MIRPMAAHPPCANCGNLCPARGPYCGAFCKAEAEFVRLCRSWLRDPARRADPNYAYVLQVRLAFLHSEYLGRGRVYDEKARYLSAGQKAAIRERDGGRCVQCGKPGAEVDHITGSSSDPDNLQLLCPDCHHAKTRQAMTAITDPADLAALGILHQDLAGRADQPLPGRACDNEQSWGTSWRSWPDLTVADMTYQQPQQAILRFADLMTRIASVGG